MDALRGASAAWLSSLGDAEEDVRVDEARRPRGWCTANPTRKSFPVNVRRRWNEADRSEKSCASEPRDVELSSSSSAPGGWKPTEARGRCEHQCPMTKQAP